MDLLRDIEREWDRLIRHHHHPKPTPIPSGGRVITVAVQNFSTVLTDEQVQQVIPALQQQLTNDFTPTWGCPPMTLEWVAKGGQVPQGAWEMGIFDDSDQAGALGYHDLSPQGLPLAKVFARSDIQNNLSWTVTVSHELLEMAGDPNIDTVVLLQDNSGNTTGYAYEACDACEGDQWGYEINGVLVSDFVLPDWFTPGTPGPFDFKGHINQPLQLIADGYIGVWTPSGGWTQKTAEEGPSYRYSARAAVGSRRERRRVPRAQWKVSVPKVEG